MKSHHDKTLIRSQWRPVEIKSNSTFAKADHDTDSGTSSDSQRERRMRKRTEMARGITGYQLSDPRTAIFIKSVAKVMLNMDRWHGQELPF